MLQPVADLYIRGMQMTVLPYLVLTLVGGLGQLDPATARRLGLRAAALLGLLIVLACAVIVVMPLAYPTLVSASFYSDALIEPAQPFALGELYVPSNPFYAMANAIVPGLVLFSSAVGVALIGVPDKAPLLASLRALERAVVRVTQLVLSLTPYGVFAISASVAGTMSLESLSRLEIYFVLFGAAALLLAFVVIPLAVAALTPFRLAPGGGNVPGGAADRVHRQQRLHRAADAGGEGQGRTGCASDGLDRHPFRRRRGGADLVRRAQRRQAADAAVRALRRLAGRRPVGRRRLPRAVRRRHSQLLRQGPGGAAFPDGPAGRAARPVPSLHPVEHRHRQVRFDGHRDEPAGAGAADGQRGGGPPADRAASHRARRC